MGQAKSFASTSAEKQIREIELELIAYKATQAYGAMQIQSRICRLASQVSSTAKGSSNYIMGMITFQGVNKNKLARGALTFATSSRVYSWYLSESSDDHAACEMKWVVLMQAGSSFTANFSAYMNMDGRITYESLI